jgi:uncharacterized membrane protein
VNKKVAAIACWVLGAVGVIAGLVAAQEQYSNMLNQLGNYFGVGQSFFSLLIGNPFFLIGLVALVVAAVLSISSSSSPSSPTPAGDGAGGAPRTASPSRNQGTERMDWTAGSAWPAASPSSASSAPSSMAVLVNGAPRMQLSVAPGSSYVIGRGNGASIHLDDQEVSATHARLDIHGPGSVMITDLASSNGTFVNGVRITTPVAISPQDTVRVGSTSVQIA